MDVRNTLLSEVEARIEHPSYGFRRFPFCYRFHDELSDPCFLRRFRRHRFAVARKENDRGTFLTFRILAARSKPLRSGMVWSVMTKSKALGSFTKVSNASLPLPAVVTP